MKLYLLTLLALTGGVFLAIQAGFNSQLGNILKQPVLAVISSSISSVIFGIIFLFIFEKVSVQSLVTTQFPWYLWFIGGLFSVIGIYIYNINNLTNLWTIASKPFNGFATDHLISYCQINNAEWPNRIWTTQQLSVDIIQSIKEISENSNANLLFVNFENLEANNTNLIESLGFKLTSSLPGMSLKLDQYFPKSTRINLKMVKTKAEAKKWSSIFKEAFGYLISAETVLKKYG